LRGDFLEFSSITDFLRRLKENFREFLFGLVIGSVACGLLILVFIDFLIFIAFANLILTAMILVSIPKSNPTKEGIAKSKPKAKAIPCPECGSTRRHKKTCSRAKK
jgi:hypothetical protein